MDNPAFERTRGSDRGFAMNIGTFTAEARREATRDGVPPIELIDGEKLIDMLANLELGLRPVTTYEIDRGFFKEFEGCVGASLRTKVLFAAFGTALLGSLNASVPLVE